MTATFNETNKIREADRLTVFGNRVLRNVLGPEREEVKGGLRKVHEVELHDLCSSPDIIMVIKSSGVRWVGHVVQVNYTFLLSTALEVTEW